MKLETYSSEYEKACHKVTCEMAEAVNASSAQMYEWDSATALARVVAECHSPQALPAEALDELGVTYDLREFPAALRHLQEKRVQVVYASSAEADMADRARLAAINSKSLLRVPLVAYDVVVGLIELRESRQARVWTDDEIRRCRTLADHAAMAVENARLRRDQRRQMALLTLLRDVNWQMTRAHNPNQLIQIIVTTVAAGLECTVDVMLLDDAGRQLVLRGAAGDSAISLPADYCQSIEEGIIGYVARTGRTYLSNDVRRDPLYLSLEGWPRGSELAVPILQENRTIGVLNVESRWPGAFLPVDAIALEILAGLLAAALENADLYTQTNQRLNELALLHEIALASAQASDVDALLGQATQVIAANLYSDNFGFLLVDEAAGLLRPHPSYHGLPSPALQMTVPLGQGITGYVAATGKPLLVPDVRADPRYTQLDDRIRSEMAAPLYLGGRLFGVLNVESRQLAAYSQDDLRLLVTITQQLAPAIENVQAQERAARAAARWSIINRIGHAATASLDATQLLQETAEAVHQQLGYDYVLTACIDGTAGLILPVGYAGGRLPRQFSRPIELGYECGLIGYAAIDRQTIYAADVSRDPRYVATIPEVRSELCVPISRADGTVLGLLDLRSRRPAAFDADDVEAVETLAAQLAVALTNAQLHQETQRRLAELTGLYELSQTFRLVTDTTRLYEQVTSLIARLLNVEQCGIVLYDSASQMMVMQQPAYGLRPEQVRRYRWPVVLDPPPAWRRGETLILNELPKNVPPSPDFNPQLAVELGERDLMVVPLMMGERCLGFVRVANKAHRAPFSAEDARLMGVFANQMAIAIDNARMLAESQRRIGRLTALQQIGMVLASSRDLQVMVEALYRELATQFEAETFSVYILDPQGQRLEYMWVDCGVYHSAEIDLDSESLGAYVTRSARPLLIADLAGERFELPVKGITTGAPARSWMGVPLFIEGRPAGAVTLQSYTPDRFGQEELKLLEQLALQIALAIQNIRFYQQARRRITDLMMLQRLGAQLGSLRDRTEMMYAVIEGARSLINPTDVRIFLYDAEHDCLTLGAARSYYRHRRGFDAPPRPDGLTMRVARSGAAVAIHDAAHHPLYADAGEEGAPGAILSLPLKRANRTLAVLNVAFADQPHTFTDEEVLILTILADQAALALDNAALFEAGQRWQTLAEALREMAAIVSARPPLDEVLHQLLNQIRRVVEYDQASVGLIKGNRLRIRAMTGFPDASTLKLEFDLDDLPLTQQICVTAQPAFLANMQDPSTYPHDIISPIGASKVRATMGIPIITQGRVIGIIYVDSFKVGVFTVEQARQVQTFAACVAPLIAAHMQQHDASEQ